MQKILFKSVLALIAAFASPFAVAQDTIGKEVRRRSAPVIAADVYVEAMRLGEVTCIAKMPFADVRREVTGIVIGRLKRGAGRFHFDEAQGHIQRFEELVALIRFGEITEESGLQTFLGWS